MRTRDGVIFQQEIAVLRMGSRITSSVVCLLTKTKCNYIKHFKQFVNKQFCIAIKRKFNH